MQVKTVRIPNKPLCFTVQSGTIYMGDARGEIYKISENYMKAELLITTDSPVSAILMVQNKIYYGTWKGVVCNGNIKKKLGTNMIKCMAIWNNQLFVSVDLKLYKLDLSLNIIESYDLPCKIYSAECSKTKILFGMGHGNMSSYSDKYEPARKSNHNGSIIALKNGLSGDTYGELRKNGELIYSGKNWIRSINSEKLFSSGHDIIKDGKLLYSHHDDVVGVVMIGDIVISFGLDFCYKIWSENYLISKEEEEELLRLVNMD